LICQTLLIFDCDGVLVDSERHIQAVDLRLIPPLGWPITVEEILTEHLGRPTEDVLANIERHIGRDLPSDFPIRRKNAYRDAVASGLEAVPGVADAIDTLVETGYLTCVASSGSPESIMFSLGKTGLLHRFGPNVFSGHQVPRGKPAPDLFLHAAQAMNAHPRSSVVIEDSPAGVAAARAAKIRVIGYASATPARLLREADLVIQHMRDLPDAVHTLLPPRSLR